MQAAAEFVIVKLDVEGEEKSAGGIIIPSTVNDNKKTQTGTVVSVGPGRRDPQNTENFFPTDVTVGQHVLFAKYIGYPIKVNGDDCVIIKHNDVMVFL